MSDLSEFLEDPTVPRAARAVLDSPSEPADAGHAHILEIGQRKAFIVMKASSKSGQWRRKELVELTESFHAQQELRDPQTDSSWNGSFDAFFEIPLTEVMLQRRKFEGRQIFPGKWSKSFLDSGKNGQQLGNVNEDPNFR